MTRKVITDEIWTKVIPVLPELKGRHEKNERLFLESIVG